MGGNVPCEGSNNYSTRRETNQITVQGKYSLWLTFRLFGFRRAFRTGVTWWTTRFDHWEFVSKRCPKFWVHFSEQDAILGFASTVAFPVSVDSIISNEVWIYDMTEIKIIMFV